MLQNRQVHTFACDDMLNTIYTIYTYTFTHTHLMSIQITHMTHRAIVHSDNHRLEYIYWIELKPLTCHRERIQSKGMSCTHVHLHISLYKINICMYINAISYIHDMYEFIFANKILHTLYYTYIYICTHYTNTDDDVSWMNRTFHRYL